MRKVLARHARIRYLVAMMKMWMVAALVLASTACGKKDPAAASLAEFGALKDRMCACTTADCANSVNKDVEAYMKSSRPVFDKMTESEKAQSKQIDDADYACWKKLK
ncbi:MAG: hypothetical protein QM831_45910 [Kofleriaceae bacterium]